MVLKTDQEAEILMRGLGIVWYIYSRNLHTFSVLLHTSFENCCPRLFQEGSGRGVGGRKGFGTGFHSKPLLHDSCWPGYTKTVELGQLPILADGTWDSWGSVSSRLKRRSLSASLSWAE